MLMQIYQLQKKYRHAIELYDELRQNLESEFGLPPLKETSQLYYKIVSEWNVSTDKETLHQMAQPLLGKEDALQKMHALCAEGWLASPPDRDRYLACAVEHDHACFSI
mgnify:CR=1 FL=1